MAIHEHSSRTGTTAASINEQNYYLVLLLLPVHEDLRGLGGLAVDGPVRGAVLVADGDAEPPVVGPDDADGLADPAGDLHVVALAVVGRLDPGAVQGLA